MPSIEHTVTNTGPFLFLVWDSKTVTFNTAVSASAQVSVLVMTLLAQHLQEEDLEEIPPGSPNPVFPSSPGVKERLYWSSESAGHMVL